ncbi:MAG TPA: hypothetical protein VEF34_20720 [Syntrophobacteraceae bacterium]|nr:hypothetical protein [Syntrophobacteraceae bacterium]
MDLPLDQALMQWLRQMAEDCGLPIDQVPEAAEEINNRLKSYPKVRHTLSHPVVQLGPFMQAISESWALGARQDIIHFKNLIKTGDSARDAIERLIRVFPNGETEACKRIDDFVGYAVKNGYHKPSGHSDWAGAALLASIILTCIYPHRFVDFRQSRWNSFAQAFGYYHPTFGEGHYGEKLISAGRVAAAFSKTHHIPQGLGEPLWIIAGICWQMGKGTLRVPTTKQIPIMRKYGHGEGRDHLKLKEWVANNPQSIGIANVKNTTLEYIFPSADAVDILFELMNGDDVVVEIETDTPVPGFYQAIKYRALMCAVRKLPLDSQKVKAILVASDMSEQARDLCCKYGILNYQHRVPQ